MCESTLQGNARAGASLTLAWGAEGPRWAKKAGGGFPAPSPGGWSGQAGSPPAPQGWGRPGRCQGPEGRHTPGRPVLLRPARPSLTHKFRSQDLIKNTPRRLWGAAHASSKLQRAPDWGTKQSLQSKPPQSRLHLALGQGSPARWGALGGGGLQTRTGILQECGGGWEHSPQPQERQVEPPESGLWSSRGGGGWGRLPVPVTSVATTQYEDETTGGHLTAWWLNTVESMCWPGVSQ